MSISNITRINIEKPIWSNQSIGIAEWRLKAADTIEIVILYKDKSGRRVFPETYQISAHELKKCPLKTLRTGTRLYIVPIQKMEVNKCLAN